MKILLRCVRDHGELWRLWLPLLLLAALAPPVVLAQPLVEKRLIDGVVVARRLDLLPATLAMYGGLWLFSSLIQTAGGTLRTYLSEQMTSRLHRRLFDHCEALSLAFSHREHTGRTLALFNSDASSVIGLFSTTLVGGFGCLVAVVFATVAMLSLSWQLALAAGLLPPLIAGVAVCVTRPLRPASRRIQEKAAEVSEHLHESLAGLREIVAFGREQAQGRRYSTALQELLRLRMRVTWMDTALGTGQNLFGLSSALILLGYGGYLVIRGETTIGTLVAMRSLFSAIFVPVTSLAGLVSSVQKSLAGAERVYAFLDERPRVRERAGARPPANVLGEITFDRVSFGYDPDRPVLENVSFTARPGEMIALVGPSGAGKSTLASLIARFYEPDTGRVLLDGVDLRDLTLAGSRSLLGIVFQDTFLFDRTIRENIAFGRDGAHEAEIIDAARAANAWEFIERLPGGLDTAIGQRGVRLSEGQKQRLAIARAFLRDPRVLILDEPTSALDARSEHLLQSALTNLIRGRTTFVIAHRLATVQQADRILVLEAGRIIEQGSHLELLRRDSLYRELYQLQFAGADRAAKDGACVSSTALPTPVSLP